MSTKAFFVVGLLVALALVLVVSPWASGAPDGLERVAVDHGLDAHGDDHALDDLPTAGYGEGGMGSAAAGAIGVTVTLAVTGGVLWFARRRRSTVPG